MGECQLESFRAGCDCLLVHRAVIATRSEVIALASLGRVQIGVVARVVSRAAVSQFIRLHPTCD